MKTSTSARNDMEQGPSRGPDRVENRPDQRRIPEEYLGNTAAQFQGYWNRLLFTGAGVPPKPFNSQQNWWITSRKTAGAIGYIDPATPHGNVRS